MDAHIKADAIAFEGLLEQLTELNKDVKSIIASRSYAAGAWKAISIIGAVILGVGTLYLMWKSIKS